MTHIRIATRTLKWVAFAIVIFLFIATFMTKIFHYIHLQSVEFNTISISPVSVALGLLASVSLLILAVIEKVVYKLKFTHPEQLIVLSGGIAGTIYNVFLLVLLFKNMVGV